MRSISLALLVLGLIGQAQSTTLVAVWTPERLLLGADSLVVTDAAPTEACKIAHEGATFFALSGLVEDRTAGFQLAPLARRALHRSGSMEEKLQSFLGSVRHPLARAVEAVRRNAPSEYAMLLQGRPVVQAIFAEPAEGSPVLAVASFAVAPDGTLSEYSSVLAHAKDRRGPRIIYAGQQSQIRAYLKSHPDWHAGDTAALVRGLIDLESRSGSGRVGGPVDLVEIGAQGANWVQKKPGCPR
jgi:hypothetical protein